MKAFLLLVAVTIMFSDVSGQSESMSCSTVNGKTICDRQKSNGNVAMSSSQAVTGGRGDFQSTFAGTGDTATGSFSSSHTHGGDHHHSGDGNSHHGTSGGFGFASAGSGAGFFPFPGFFGPGIVYPPNHHNAPSSGAYPEAQEGEGHHPHPYPAYPVGFNPFGFVNQFMGGGFPMFPGAGGFAFAGRR